MICIDSSAIVAIVKDEPERAHFMRTIDQAAGAAISATNYFEAAMVCEGSVTAPGRVFFDAEMETLRQLGLTIVAFDDTQADLARDGFRRYGRGRHPAALNFGDCFAYALAKALDAPLLYKGTDFARTDLKSA
ncbi:MAG: type II toxin-antitoxin system VapC family toxin [Terricaulis sp.]